MRSGISRRHGGHQVAQTLTTSVLPRYEARETLRPSSVVREKSGAGLPTCGPVSEGRGAGASATAGAPRAPKTTARAIRVVVRIPSLSPAHQAPPGRALLRGAA